MPARTTFAVGALVAFLVAFAWELGRDRGEVSEARIVAERQAGKTWHYQVEGGEFAVKPITGLLHGYPRVGDTTEVRRHGEVVTWNAWAARYPFTAIFGLLAVSTGVALAIARHDARG